MTMNIKDLRAATPGCHERIHLNNAGSALMPVSVISAIHQHIDLEAHIGGYEAAYERRQAVEGTYRAVADLIGTNPGNIAFTDNATASYAQALSSIPFQRDDLILTTRNDYASNQIQFLSLRARLGVRVMRAPDRPDGGVDTEAMRELIHCHHPRLVCVTHIPTNSGLVQDVAAIGAVCQERGIPYLVDACQSVGQMPLDVREIGCDFLSASFRKFLRGPRGVGFLYVSDAVLMKGLEPLFIDMRGAEWTAEDGYRAAPDATRFETWEFACALVLGAGEAARYAKAIGLDRIRDRARALASRLRTALARIDRVRVLDRGRELGAIVSMSIDGREPQALVTALRDRGINASAQVRAYAVIDYDDKAVASSLRMSPHYYNTEDEIDRAVSALEEVVSAPR
jgi:selenocysteine lyase/cysteine desulfurase